MIKIEMTITFTKVIGLITLILSFISMIILNDTNIFLVALPTIAGMVANQDYQRRKKHNNFQQPTIEKRINEEEEIEYL